MIRQAPSAIDLQRELSLNVQGKVHVDEPMSRYNTFGLGGSADLFVLAETVTDLQTTLQFASSHHLPIVALGDGSNVLIADRGIRGIVVKMVGGFDNIQINDEVLTVGAGVGISKMIAHASAAGFAGPEILYGVPGSVGGGVYMNAGTRYGWLSDILIDAELVERDGRVIHASPQELDMSYRHSALQDSNAPAFVTSARIQLKAEEPASVKSRIASIARARQQSQPLNWRSCGCMFKNPEGDSAGRLIDACGLKGLSVGSVAVSDKHANFFVTREKCSAADVRALAGRVQNQVSERFGVDLELEVRLLGEWVNE